MTTSPLGNVEITYALVTEVDPHPENANVGNIEVIKESIRVNGFYSALVVQSSTGYILAGNHRYLAAKDLGYEQVPVIYLDVDDETAKRIMLADNRTTRLGHDDDEALRALLEELGDSELGLLGTGFTHAELQTLQDAADTFSEDLLPEPAPSTSGAFADSKFQVEPLEGPGGTCKGVIVTRFDHAPLTVEDYNHIRVALGLGRASRGALATTGIEDWA